MDWTQKLSNEWLWRSSTVGLGIVLAGGWTLVHYLRCLKEHSQINCMDLSMWQAGAMMLQHRGDIGKFHQALVERYGHAPLKLNALGIVRLVIVSSPGMFQLSPLPKGRWYASLRALWGHNSLITLNHEGHRRHRRLLSHGFSMSSLHKFIPALEHHAKRLVNAWQSNLVDVNIHEWMTRLTFDIIADLAFGYDANCLGDSEEGNVFVTSCCKIAKMVMHHWLHIPGLAHVWRLLHYRTFALVDRTIYECITKRKAERTNLKSGTGSDSPGSSRKGSASARDLLDLMLDSGDWSDLELRDEVFIFYLAGHETTAVTMTWILIHISNDLHLQQRMREEIQTVLGPDPLTKDTEKQLQLMTNVIKETLRLYPPAFAFTRFAENEVNVDGTLIPAGYDIMINLLSVQRNPQVFDRPTEWIPERWEHNPEGKGPDGRVYFSPFSFGQRQCIGINLAWLEMKATLCTILRAFELRLVGDKLPGWNTFPISVSPDDPMRVQLKPLK